MERLEALSLEVVDDAEGDPGFVLLDRLVGWMVALQGFILCSERWNRRVQRKRAVLGDGEARGKLGGGLGGGGALERGEVRARERWREAREGMRKAPASARDEGDPGLRRDDGKSKDDDNEHHASASSSSRRRPGSPEGERKPSEFMLARLPSRTKAKRHTRRSVGRSAARYETPIPVWPCEVMPERFVREWWKEAKPRGARSRQETKSKFPEGRVAGYPGPPDGEAGGRHRTSSRNDGGPASSAGTSALPGIA